MRFLALWTLFGILFAPLIARADAVNGTVATVRGYQDHGATEVIAFGPLAASLQGKPVVVRVHADW